MKSKPVPAPPTQFLLLREAQAAKLGQYANGAITYQVLRVPDGDALYLRVSANAGGGYFSREAVPVEAVRLCLAGRDAAEPLRAAALRSAYVGRSNNNAGFLAALLVAEGLLTRDPDAPHLLMDAGRWDAWEAEQRALAGDGTLVRVGADPAPAAPPPEAESAPKAKAPSKGKAK